MGGMATLISMVAIGKSQEVAGEMVVTATELLSATMLSGFLAPIRAAAPGVRARIVASSDVQSLAPRSDEGGVRQENESGVRQEDLSLDAEVTDAGEQTLVPGVEPVTDRQRAKADMARPSSGRDAGTGSGRDDLFGNPEDRRDRFDEGMREETTAKSLRKITLAARAKHVEGGDKRPKNATDISTSPQAKRLYADLSDARSVSKRPSIADDFVLKYGREANAELLVALNKDGIPLEITKGAIGQVNVAPWVYRAAEMGEIA